MWTVPERISRHAVRVTNRSAARHHPAAAAAALWTDQKRGLIPVLVVDVDLVDDLVFGGGDTCCVVLCW